MFRGRRKLRRKVSVFLSHLKTRYDYDFPLYFPRELFMSFRNTVYNMSGGAVQDIRARAEGE